MILLKIGFTSLDPNRSILSTFIINEKKQKQLIFILKNVNSLVSSFQVENHNFYLQKKNVQSQKVKLNTCVIFEKLCNGYWVLDYIVYIKYLNIWKT